MRVDEGLGLLLVADGMGGHPGGDIASRMVGECVERALSEASHTLATALEQAHRMLLEAGRSGRGAPGMGTTCVAARLHGRMLEVAWVGDSRIYRARAGRLEQISRDHSWVQRLVDAGELAASERDRHPQRHVLAQCLGGFDTQGVEVESEAVALEAGQRLLLCTDGLTGELDDATIGRILAQEADDEQAADALVDAALAAGGRDNVTVIVATV